MSGINEDTPDSRWTKKALMESEKRYRRLLDNSPDIIFRMSLPDRRYEYVSPAAVQLTGYTPEDYYSHSGLLEKLIPPDCKEYFKKEWKALLKGDMPPFYEYQIIDRAGKTRWFYQRNMLIKDEFGHPISIEGIITDITGQKQAEEALHKTNEKLRSITENSPDMILLINTKWEILSINHTLTLEPGQVIGKSVLDLIPVEFRDEAISCFEQVRTTGKPGSYHTEYHFPTGEMQHFDSNVGPVFHGGEIETLVINARDITGRKVAEEALRESENRYRTLAESSTDNIFIIGRDDSVRYVNSYAARNLHLPTDEIIGKPRKNFFHLDIADTQGRSLQKMFETGEPFRDENKIPLGNQVFWLDTTLVPLKDEAGNVTAVLGVSRDITERKQAEEAIRQASKKLTLLSSITRHDISNQLTVLFRYLTILENKQPDPTLNEYFLKVNTATKRISAMVKFTQEYESIGVNAPVWQDTRTLVDTAAKQAPLGKVIVKNDLPAGSEVFADPLIGKVFYNLMDNAVRYGGKITTIRFSSLESGDDQVIVCEDDGDGVITQEKEKIFERGFGKNTGLGLALSREILSITGTTIRETGEPGKGAQFEITVPKGTYRMNADKNAGKRSLT
jgi:PAS domain S-box-containing protein